MTRRRVILLTLLAISVLVISLIGWRHGGGRSVTLADGSRLTVLGVNVGTECSRFYGSFLSRLAEELPDAMRRRLPRGLDFQFSYPTGTNIVFWLHLERVPASTKQLQFALGDDTGTFATIRSAPVIRSLTGGGAAAYLAETVWPRRAATVILRVFDEGLDTPTQLAGELRIANPAAAAYPQWTPETIPATRRLDDTLITLERFETRPMPAMFWRLSRTNVLEPVAFIELQSSNTTQAADAPWQLFSARLSDATGNFRTWQQSRIPAGGTRSPVITNLKIPWPGENVYRLETRWRPSTPLAPGELITVRGVVLSPAPKPPGLVGGGRHESVDFEIYASASRSQGAEAQSLVPGWRLRIAPIPRPNTPQLDDPTHHLALTAATDEHGRTWPGNEQGEVDVPADAGTIVVTVAARVLKVAQFTVRPERLASGIPLWRAE